MNAEVKLRQITQTTLKDLKAKLKDRNQEIEVLKEMVRSANRQAKSKDIDIARLSKKIQRLEKFNVQSQQISSGASIHREASSEKQKDKYGVIMEEQEDDEEQQQNRHHHMSMEDLSAPSMKSHSPLPQIKTKTTKDIVDEELIALAAE